MTDPREGAEFFPGIYIKENLSLAYVAHNHKLEFTFN